VGVIIVYLGRGIFYMNRVFVGAAVGLATVVSVLLSQQQVVSANPAIAMKSDGECGMPGADENGDMIFGGTGEMTTDTETNNRVTMKCRGIGITNDSGRTQTFEGFSCAIYMADGSLVVTDNSQAKVTAKGVGTMSCVYTK
jgi:hypothetical protein